MAIAPSLAQLVYRGASLDPAAPAVIDGDTVISHGELIQRVESTGAELSKLLPGRGSRVAICAQNHSDHLVAYLAVLLAGFVWVPLNPANGRTLNTRIAEMANPDLVLVDEQSVDQAPVSDCQLSLGAIDGNQDEFVLADVSATEVAAIKFTGGTSGEPKGVLQTHGNMLAVIENMQSFYEFDSKDCNLAIAPLTHGSSHYVIPVLAAGGRHRFLRDTAPESVLDALRAGTTIAFMPPTLIYKLLREDGIAAEQFPALRHLTYSAAPMPVRRIVEVQATFGPRLSTLYGQTEAPVTISALGPAEMMQPRLRSTVGRACHNSRIRIVDDRGLNVPAGAVGQLEAKGPIVMQAYLDNPELTAATLSAGWLRTGDLASIDEAGYVTLAGRANELIISGGFNVHPAEIENALAGMEGIRESCVFSVADDYWGERIEAMIVTRPDARLGKEEILQHVKQELGAVRTPKALYFVAELPRNAVGKVVRRDMPALVATMQEDQHGTNA